MKNAWAALVVGFLFAIGVSIAGMVQPQKVVGFFDFFGQWDPTLMFVMLGALSVHSFSYYFIMKRTSPLLSSKWHVPTKREITPTLVSGSFIFGMGWALAGLCPGPAIVSVATMDLRVIIFIFSMLVGMFIFSNLDKKFKFRK